MAKYTKGVSGNPKGRPKGTKDKITQRMLSVIADIFEDNVDKLKQDFEELKSKDRVDAMLKLCDYYVPKAKQEIEINNSKITIEQELEKLINEN